MHLFCNWVNNNPIRPQELGHIADTCKAKKTHTLDEEYAEEVTKHW